MAAPARKTRKRKGTARASLKPAREDPRASKLAEARAAYREAREQRAAMAHILRIIAKSPADTDAVFKSITRAAARLIPESRSALFLARDGMIKYGSNTVITEARQVRMQKLYPAPLTRDLLAGVCILDRRVLHLADVPDAEKKYPRAVAMSRISGYRSILQVPLISAGKAIGALAVTRASPGTFTAPQVALVESFADQAVIAIRNASFFREINERNAELKKSFDFQGATGEILGSLSSSVTDTKPVFDAIVRNVPGLFGTQFTAVFLLRGEMLELAALKGHPDFEKRFVSAFPQPVNQRSLTGRVLRTGKLIQVTPIVGNPESMPESVRLAKEFDYNSMMIAPMIRDGKTVGAIATAHRESVAFDDKQVALLKAFADQAVIAIENARLFRETKEALER